MYDLFKYNTEIAEELHEEFLKSCIAEKKVPFNELNQGILKQRKEILNKNFVFSEKNLSIMELMLQNFNNLQYEIINKHLYLLRKAKPELIENGGNFTHIEYDIYVSFYFQELVGNYYPIYESNEIFYTQIECTDDVMIETNTYFGYEDSTELDLKLYRLGMNRLFFHLYHESHLALQDILMIDLVTFDIKVSYHTGVEILK